MPLAAALSFVALNVSAIVAAAAVASRLGQRDAPWRRWLIGTSAYGLLATVLVLLAGLAHQLTIGTVMALSIAVAALARLALRRAGTAPGPDPQRAETGIGARLAFALLAGLLGSRLATAAFGPTAIQWDDLSYHALVAGQWLVDQRISLVASTYQAYYPFGSELVSLWFMLPFGSDSHVSLAGFYWLFLAAVSLYAIVRGTGGSTTAASLVASLVVASPVVTDLTANFAPTDVASTALVLAAIAVSMPSADRPRETPSLILSGLLVGMAVGCKVTAAAAGAVVLAWWLMPQRRRATGMGPLRLAASFLLAALLAGGYWYLRNWITTGNPLYPAEVGPFAGPFDAASQTRTKAWHWLTGAGIPSWQFRAVLAWPLLTALIALAGYLTALQGVARRVRRPAVDDVLLVVGLLTLAAYPFLPFSGTINQPHAVPDLITSRRYALLALIAGVLLYRHWLDAAGARGRWATALAALALIASLMSQPLAAWPVLAGFAVLGGGLMRCRPRTARAVLGSAALVAICASAVFQPAKALATAHRLFSTADAERPVGRAWQQLEQLPPGSRIAFFMSEPAAYTHNYPLFGRSLQHRPVYVDERGQRLQPLHRPAAEAPQAWWAEWAAQGDDWGRRDPHISAETLVRNLTASGVDYVISSRWSRGHWPPQHALLQSAGGVQSVYDDGYSVIWKIPAD